ncbi:MAG: hypothetical protein AAF208_12765 [Cyanobacteria bacterium P01_A01_bin.45]
MEDLHLDLQLLGQRCQENLRAEIPSGEFFLVKCAVVSKPPGKGDAYEDRDTLVKNNLLMILTEHPEAVNVDTQSIFTVLEESLYSELNLNHLQVELFVRHFGTKLPYIKRSIDIHLNSQLRENLESEDYSSEIGNVVIDATKSTQKLNSSSTKSVLKKTNPPSQEKTVLYSPLPISSKVQTTFSYSIVPFSSEFADRGNAFNTSESFSTYSYTSKSDQKFPKKGAIAAAVLSIMAIFGSAGHMLMSPCVSGECKELQTAILNQQNLQTEVNNIKSAAELLALQQKIDLDRKTVQSIPVWSPHHTKAVETIDNLSEQSGEINLVVKAFKSGKTASQISQTKAESIEELQARQELWRKAIAPLESISTHSDLYPLVKPKLFNYSTNLKIVNRQLLTEKKWLKKINDSKSVAAAAKKRTTKATSLESWQKAESTWQIAVNALKGISKNSVVYSDAQKLLSEYLPLLNNTRKRATKELIAEKSYNLGFLAAKEARKYAQINQWSLAVSHWNQAVNAIKGIPKATAYDKQAKSQIQNYSLELQQAQQNLRIAQKWQKTRNDLEQTCYGEIEICEYTLDNQGIIVRITSEYEQSLEASFIDASLEQDPQAIASVNNHMQILQQALEAISSNADLPLLVYDAGGEIIQKSRLVM